MSQTFFKKKNIKEAASKTSEYGGGSSGEKVFIFASSCDRNWTHIGPRCNLGLQKRFLTTFEAFFSVFPTFSSIFWSNVHKYISIGLRLKWRIFRKMAHFCFAFHMSSWDDICMGKQFQSNHWGGFSIFSSFAIDFTVKFRKNRWKWLQTFKMSKNTLFLA